jgi:glutathione S-transferase
MYQLHYFAANARAAPHMLLEELGVDYALSLVDRANNAQKFSAYLKINPKRHVLTLVDGNLIVSEAAAIVLHLVDQHADAGLAPRLGTPERTMFYQWLIFQTNSLQEELMIWQYPDRLAGNDPPRATLSNGAPKRAPGIFSTLSRAISGTMTRCFRATGSAPSIYIWSCSRAGRVRWPARRIRVPTSQSCWTGQRLSRRSAAPTSKKGSPTRSAKRSTNWGRL